MKIKGEKPFRLVNIVNATSKAGNPYTKVTVADEATYLSQEFFLSKETNPNDLMVQTCYEVEVVFEGKFTGINLRPVRKLA